LAFFVGEILRGLILYVPKESPVYRLHPAAKLFMLVALSFCSLATHSYYLATFVLALVLVIVAMAKIPWSSLRIYTLVVGWMLMMSFILYSIFTPVTSGTVLFKYWLITIGLNNILIWLLVAIKWFSASYITAVLLVTTKQRDIVLGLRTWKVPFIVCFIAASVLRQLAVVSVDFFTAVEAQMSRGLDFRQGSVFTRLARFVRVGIPLLFVSFKRMEDMSNAMQSRAFTATGKKTVYTVIPLKASDMVVMLLLGGMTVLVLANTYLGVRLPVLG
jgi:energy-coupling factor transport system permease protein